MTDPVEMAQLPPELVERIFEAVRESEPPSYGTIDFPDAYHHFFDNASLVCKTWNHLAKPFRTTFTVKRGCGPFFTNRTDGFARHGQQLAWRLPIENLHIRTADDSNYDAQADSEATSLSPHSFQSLLAPFHHTITSLSLETDLLSRHSLEPGGVLEKILKHVHRLHIYSREGAQSHVGQDIIVPSHMVMWTWLADTVWNNSERTAPFKELSCTRVSIVKKYTGDAGEEPCPAERVILKDVYFHGRFTHSKIFPAAKELVLEQSERWFWKYDHPDDEDIVDPPEAEEAGTSTETLAALNIRLDSGSTVLQRLQVTWVELPPKERVHFPLRNNLEILKSPNLASIEINATRCDSTVIHHEINRRDMLEQEFQDRSSSCLKSLSDRPSASIL